MNNDKQYSQLVAQHAIVASREHGKTQKWLAKAIGVEESRLSEAKNGQYILLPSAVERIAELFGLPRREAGKFIRAEIYDDLDIFIENFETISHQRHLARLVTLFSREDYQLVLCDFFTFRCDAENNYPPLSKRLALIEKFIEQKCVREWYRESRNMLCGNQWDCRFPQFPVLPTIELNQFSFYEPNKSRLDSATNAALYWLLAVKEAVSGYQIGDHIKAEAQALIPVILTGDTVLDTFQRTPTEALKTVSNRYGISKAVEDFPVYARRTGFGHSVPREAQLNSKPDEWEQVDASLYLNSEMHYNLHISLRQGIIDSNFPALDKQRRDIVVRNISHLTLFKTLEKLRKWMGFGDSLEDTVKSEVALAGGYVPGALVL